MESRSHAIAAGLFAIILSCALVGALWWFSDRRDATRDVLLVSSGSVNGLNVQATVRYRGIVAGKVAAINLDPADPRNVLVTARIRTDLPITRATRARLANQGVTGLAFIALDDAGDDPVPLLGGGGGPPRLKLAPGLVDEVALFQSPMVLGPHAYDALAGRPVGRLLAPVGFAEVERADLGADRLVRLWRR